MGKGAQAREAAGVWETHVSARTSAPVKCFSRSSDRQIFGAQFGVVSATLRRPGAIKDHAACIKDHRTIASVERTHGVFVQPEW